MAIGKLTNKILPFGVVIVLAIGKLSQNLPFRGINRLGNLQILGKFIHSDSYNNNHAGKWQTLK